MADPRGGPEEVSAPSKIQKKMAASRRRRAGLMSRGTATHLDQRRSRACTLRHLLCPTGPGWLAPALARCRAVCGAVAHGAVLTLRRRDDGRGHCAPTISHATRTHTSAHTDPSHSLLVMRCMPTAAAAGFSGTAAQWQRQSGSGADGAAVARPQSRLSSHRHRSRTNARTTHEQGAQYKDKCMRSHAQLDDDSRPSQWLHCSQSHGDWPQCPD